MAKGAKRKSAECHSEQREGSLMWVHLQSLCVHAKCGLVAFMTSRLVAMSSSFTIFVCHLVIFSIFVISSLLNFKTINHFEL